MNIIERYSYGKNDRLKSRKLINMLFSEGKICNFYPLKALWLPMNNHFILQAGVGVSSRYFKKATDRNRIKRLLREAYRLHKNELIAHLQKEGKTLSVFFIYTGKDLPQFEIIREKTELVISKLINATHEKTTALS